MSISTQISEKDLLYVYRLKTSRIMKMSEADKTAEMLKRFQGLKEMCLRN